MSAFRTSLIFGRVLIALAVIVGIATSSLTEGFSGLLVPLLIVIAVSAAVALLIRLTVPLDWRRKAIRSLSPRMGRRLLPPSDVACDDDDDDDDRTFSL